MAVEILRRGEILSRNAALAGPGLICDVANQGALWNNPQAHDYVRLYFRPKNKFHLKTEGIKSSIDIYRVDPHMTIPVTFLFKFDEVMTRENCFFLPQNFAIGSMAPLSGDDNFAAIDFAKTYHDSAPRADQMDEIHRARMAEAVVRDRLPLNSCQAILVRNEYDRRTLLHLTGRAADAEPKCFLDQRGGVFFKRGMYLQEATLLDGTLLFSFSGPNTAPMATYSVCITHGDFHERYDLASVTRWKVNTGGASHIPVHIDIENCLAFYGCLPAGNSAVV